tara:strand:- start:266 stop:517 length:252 start_codon:yes stop_codon:yes gene_type:complete
MEPQLKKDIINIMFNQYDLDAYQKESIQKIIDGCVELAAYQNGDVAEDNLDIIAGLIRGHIINLLNVLGIKKDGKKRIETAES